MINVQDQTLTCRDCGQAFVFTAGEREAFAQQGRYHAPSRCAACRETRKARQAASGARPRSLGDAFARREREFFPAVCAECGKATRVPFQPRQDRPVYCSECYSARRPSAGYDRRAGSRRPW